MIPYLGRVLALNYGNDMNLTRNAIYSSENNLILISGRDYLILFTIIFSFVIASLLITTYMFYSNQINVLIVILCILEVLLYSWITGGRSLLVREIVFMIFGYFLLGKSQLKYMYLSPRVKRVTLIMLIFIVITLLIQTNLRSGYYNEGVLFWGVVYLSGPIIFLSEMTSISSIDFDYQYGSILIGGLLHFPIYYTNKFFGTNIITAAEKLSFLNVPINIRDGPITLMYNSLGSAIMNLYYDSGVIGIIIGFILLAVISNIVFLKIKKNKGMLMFCTALLLYYCIVFSISRWEPFTIWPWSTIFVIFVLNYLLKMKKV
jgi:oligosaccharide repeat unit polymerase